VDGADPAAVAWVSRVHVDDICGAVLSSMARPRPGAVYNVADALPTPRRQVLDAAAGLLGIPAASFGDPGRGSGGGSGPVSSRSLRAEKENKRVRAALLASELGYQLMYPSYLEGLSAILEGETEPGH
jgi:nucleoside-diphosphate-sugar epimerase